MAVLTDAEKADLRTVHLPDQLILRGRDRRSDFEDVVGGWITTAEARGMISMPKLGYGFATSGVVSEHVLRAANLEDLTTYIASGFTVGDVPERYMWNAVRKIYELLRLFQKSFNLDSTLEAFQWAPEFLRDAVPSFNDEDGSVPWGPFPYGGAVIRSFEGKFVLAAFSVWKQEEDDLIARQAARWMLNIG